MSLKLDWCSYEAAEYAVMHWHYSHTMPKSRLTHIGVWENAQFIGCVLFGRGSNNRIGAPFGLKQTEVCELVRIALRAHGAPVSRIVSIALHMLRGFSPGLRLIVSYADPKHHHHGGIYQALGWIYAGPSQAQRELSIAGRFMHKRTASSKWGTASPERIHALTGLDVAYGPVEWKHTYYLPLDLAMRAQIAPLAQPYPKRAGSIAVDAVPIHGTEGGSIPTPALPIAPITRRNTIAVNDGA